MPHHWSNRSPGVRPLCSTATRPGNLAEKRSMVWWVSAISGTSAMARLPRRRHSSTASRYTSVLPLPVTPCSRKVRGDADSSARTARISLATSSCSGVSAGGATV